jgi:hypothetical protein
MGKMLAVVVAAAASTVLCATPAHADPPPPGCERVPILGLNPQIREICDLPIQPDGSWERWRWFSHPEFVSSSCGGVFEGYDECPQWSRERSPAWQGPVEKYVLTADSIPPGEPGYIGG